MTLLLTTSGNSWVNWNFSWAQTIPLSHFWEYRLYFPSKGSLCEINSFLSMIPSALVFLCLCDPASLTTWELLLNTAALSLLYGDCADGMRSGQLPVQCCGDHSLLLYLLPCLRQEAVSKAAKTVFPVSPKIFIIPSGSSKMCIWVAFSQGGPRRSKISSL